MALRDLVGTATRQILASQLARADIAEIISTYRDAVTQAMKVARADKIGAESISALLDARPEISGVFELVDLARNGNRPLEEIVMAYAQLDVGLDLGWLNAAIGHLPAGNRWQARARAQLGSDLRELRRALLQQGTIQPSSLGAARQVVEELKRNAPQDLAMLSAGLNEIKLLLLDR